MACDDPWGVDRKGIDSVVDVIGEGTATTSKSVSARGMRGTGAGVTACTKCDERTVGEGDGFVDTRPMGRLRLREWSKLMRSLVRMACCPGP